MKGRGRIARRWQRRFTLDQNTMKKMKKIANDHDCYISHVIRTAISEYYDNVYPERSER